MKSIKFKEYQQQISEAIQNNVLSKSLIPPDPKGFTLVEGFFYSVIQEEIGNVGLALGGPSIPTVKIVANSSGLIYSFALKALLPQLDI